MKWVKKMWKRNKNQAYSHKMDFSLKEQMYELLMALHNWRKDYNADNIGFGYDQYKPNEEFHYAEAYALWGEGYMKIYQFTHQNEFLKLAEKCGDWLIRNKNARYKNFSWGLPWDWEERKAPKELSYLITTILVGDFFLSLYNITSIKQYLAIAESIAKWILEENGTTNEENGTWFYYANHPSFRFSVINVSGKASGFFSNLYLHTQNTDYKKLAADSVRYVINNQNGDGSWYYSTERAYIDNVHTGFTIEGLCDACTVFPSLKGSFQRPLIVAHEFYWNKLYTSRGFGKESVVNRLLHKITDKILLVNPETRLYGYAAGIRAFTKSSRILGIENKGLTIAEYVIENLKTENGAFKFKTNDDKYYIRNEAHIFDALATLISNDKFI
jgi:hypothetical protein